LQPPNQSNSAVHSELVRRHKAASITVIALLVTTILLSVVTFLSKGFLRQQNNPTLDIALRITILIFGLGSVALRRTRFAAMRLQDIGALQGASGLVRILETTTLQVARLGAAIAFMGFVATLVTGNDFYAYGAGLVATAVLLYCYPTRNSWQRTVQQFAPTPEGAAPASKDTV
jgi:hypothetical protein